jgi:ABC-2 type transport system ATP-binding protein
VGKGEAASALLRSLSADEKQFVVEPLIDARGLTKRYGEREALGGVSFSVAAGEIVGLLGPNGAGKSTTLSIIATLLAPDSGSVTVGGHPTSTDGRAARRLLGFVPQREALYPPLSARENLLFFGAMQGLSRREAVRRTYAVLELVALEARADEPISQFSVGMRRRLNLACGIVHEPRVILLDEPTVGVDPQSRERIFEGTLGLKRAGAAIVYSTHYMDEAERLCDRVVLLDLGRVVATGTPAELIAAARLKPRVVLRTSAVPAAGWERAVDGARILSADGTRITVEVDDRAAVPALLVAALRAGGEVAELELRQPNLADVFFAETGRALRDEAEAA